MRIGGRLGKAVNLQEQELQDVNDDLDDLESIEENLDNGPS